MQQVKSKSKNKYGSFLFMEVVTVIAFNFKTDNIHW